MLEIVVLYSILLVVGTWLGIEIWRNSRLQNKVNVLMDNYIHLALNKGYFVRKPSFIRYDEKVLFDVLLQVCSDKYHVIPQARLSDLVDIKSGMRDHENLYLALGEKSVDFLLLRKNDLFPVLAIELNGEYHNWYSQRSKDATKKMILEFAGIPMLPINKAKSYSNSEIEKVITEAISSI